jgi:hypothetical protein
MSQNVAGWPSGAGICMSPFFEQANYINALAVYVLRFFEPAGLTTLGRLSTTLGNLVSIFICLFFIYHIVTHT